ncbi:MAG: 50S ribosome-binding GTPase, partial [Candidatus Magnetomorum sp.]|nr:50S ribosome-binding GTPase [Candidatus Magnetomorum sp.]
MSSQLLKNNLTTIRTWAQQNVILSTPEKVNFLHWCDQLDATLDQALRAPLKIGLLGGTGVGKSSIINRLAGKEISVAHNERPYTDKVIVYHHNDLDAMLMDNLPLAIIHKHDRQDISHLILYDFPDYDSLMHEHREMVQQYSCGLDIIVWVASPEKYADQAMIQIMPTLLQSSKNYCFVLNKIDQLSPEDTAQIIGHWNMLLSQSDISDAPIFAVSTLLMDDHQNDSFEPFRKWIFKKRKEHEIIAITQSNIENQINQKTQQLCQQINGQAITDVRNKLDKINSELNTFEKNRQNDILEILTPDAHSAIHGYLAQQTQFLWPVGVAFALVRRLKKISVSNTQKAISQKVPEMFLMSTDRHIHLLQQHTAISENNISLSTAYQDFINRYQDPNQIAPFLGKMSPLQTFFFVMKQWLGLSIPVILFVLYLGGVSNWDISTDTIALRNILPFLFKVIIRLFHPEGLIALVSLLFIELFLCLQLASAWYKRM